MRKRLQKDLYDTIRKGYKIYWKKTEYKIYYNYYILWVLEEKKLPVGIIREYIFPYLGSPITCEDINNIDDIPYIFILKKIINERRWNIQFCIPAAFPFRPPKITLNKLSIAQLKNIGHTNTDANIKVLDLLVDIDKHFYSSWSPVTTIGKCIDLILRALDIHHNLSYKSNFLLSVDSLI